MQNFSPRLIIGISGASGAIYGIRALEVLRELNVHTHLVISRAAQITIAHETEYTLTQVQALAGTVHSAQDISACIASGSYACTGMLIAPCSMRSLAEIASGCTTTLLTRAADVTLKERRKLVLLPRETPLHLGHLRNMVTVTEMGGIIAPPVPTFYAKPQTLAHMVDHTIGRALELLGIPNTLAVTWEGLRT